MWRRLFKESAHFNFVHLRVGALVELSGPLDRLNAILSLLQPLDRYRATCAIGSAIGRALSRPISRPRTGASSQPPCPKPSRGLNRAIVGYSVPNPFKISAKPKHDRDHDSQPHPRQRLNSQLQGATKRPNTLFSNTPDRRSATQSKVHSQRFLNNSFGKMLRCSKSGSLPPRTNFGWHCAALPRLRLSTCPWYLFLCLRVCSYRICRHSLAFACAAGPFEAQM